MVSEPRPFPSSTLRDQQGEESTPDCCSKEHRAPYLPSPQLEGFLSQEHFHPVPTPANCCRGQVLGKCSWEEGTPFFCPALICGLKHSAFGIQYWEYWRPKLPYHSLWQQRFYTGRVKQRGPKAVASLPPSNQLLECGCHSERSMILSTHPAPEAWLRFSLV